MTEYDKDNYNDSDFEVILECIDCFDAEKEQNYVFRADHEYQNCPDRQRLL